MSTDVIACPHCASRAMPAADGLCPECRKDTRQPVVPHPGHQSAPQFVPNADTQNPYRSPQAELAPPHVVEAASMRSRKRSVLWGMGLLFAVQGFLLPIVASRAGVQIITWGSGLVFLGMLVHWCRLDAEEMKIEPWEYLAPMMVFCPGPFILLPIYFISTRGARGIVSILLAAAFLACLIVLSAIAAVLGSLVSGQPIPGE